MVLPELLVFLNGLIIGIIIAAPVGPIALLCIKRTLLHGRIIGFATGAGAAAADTFYGAIAVMGVSSIIGFFEGYQEECRLTGGIFLMFLAYKAYYSNPKDMKQAPDEKNWLKAFLSSVFLTLTNPLTFIAFITSFAAFGIGNDYTHIDNVTIILGILAGSTLWWFLLTSLVLALRRKISAKTVIQINKGSAFSIFLLALFAIVTGAAKIIGFNIF